MLELLGPAKLGAALRSELQSKAALYGTDSEEIVVRSGPGGIISDRDILKHFLGFKERQKWLQGDLTGVYLLTFALRHQLTLLAVLSHAAALPERKGPVWDKLASIASAEFARPDLEIELAACGPLFDARFWLGERTSAKDLVPVFGFSAVGAHILLLPRGRCRAFDYYDGVACGRTCDGLFCPEHAHHAFWRQDIEPRSIQTKMFSFYAALENLWAYGESELESMVDDFWKRMAKELPALEYGDADVCAALERFGYLSLETARKLGAAELKHRYLAAARACHPDAGGESEAFVALGRSYEVLKSALNSFGS